MRVCLFFRCQAMMDRRKQEELPKMQVGFIDAICTPIYKLLTEVENGLDPLYQGCTNNRQQWQSLADKVIAQDQKNANPPPQTELNKKKSADLVVAEKNQKNSSAGTKVRDSPEKIYTNPPKEAIPPSPDKDNPIKSNNSKTCEIL
ncbi:hypothetical protein LSH36_939g00002 [Paralvinella palmiformis]|uniref:PDEase domain-containing protein n=1 Tax=Paralvinella palmiformis TaxID=53620 RepID=A0AAD9IXL2_9ANNE|nr:hypothetical protein LSH36_939g00002 [Paralvinella palmiformis]